MATELQMLAWAIVLGLAQLAIAATLGTRDRGLSWNVGARDGVPAPLSVPAARMDRAFRNFLETFAFFAAAVLAVVATQRGNAHTALGAQLYVWGRLAYVPLYAFGVPYARTLAWTVATAGLVMVLLALF